MVTCGFQAVLRRGEAGNYLSMEGGSGPGTYLTSTESIYSAVSQHSNYPGMLPHLSLSRPSRLNKNNSNVTLCSKCLVFVKPFSVK